MTVKLAYKMCVGIFKQDSTGSVLGSLPDPFKSTKWNLTSIIPTAYDYTNFQVGDTTVETIETNTITQLTKARQYDSGAVTPPTLNLATLLPADAATIIATLDALDVDDPYKILVCAGHYKSVSDSVRTYDVFHAAAGILTTDGGRSGEAKQNFAGSLGIQECHLPILGVANCAATMTWNTSTGVVTLVPGSASGSGSGSGVE